MDRIESILKEKGLTKAAFAELMGTSRQNVNSLLKNPTREKLEAIANALEVPIWQLFASPEEVVCNTDGNDFTAFVRNGGELRAFDSAESLKEYVDGLCGEAKSPDHTNIRGKEYYRKSIMKMENKKMENIFIIKDGCLYDEMRYLKESVANRINSNICQLQHSGVNVMIRSMPEKPEDQEAFIKQNGYKREPELYDKLIIEYNTAHPKEPLSWWPRPNEKE